ncbi:fungal-specific transcription factor domain-containing protein [Fimicolochytrium jonesii]|uniref:fungal-specific transcription factor domain-containing protein n=1 Tax=Fimicolochytrium jonesii TaxID=1396493 RepID=UPI0022FEDB37|nr:fungal-specific transcription factor domain-containing protein [Fimicolochytrium jonesii]KAI8818752.1 fungal-specific transcription factor domain-containing protein [Fimicolochytrium jonesii]
MSGIRSDFGGAHRFDDHSDEYEDDPSRPGIKRKRSHVACDTCQRKKLKCDGVKPSCTTCLQTFAECTYRSEAQKRSQHLGGDHYMRHLDSQIKHIESVINPAQTDNGAGNPFILPSDGNGIERASQERLRSLMKETQDQAAADEDFNPPQISTLTQQGITQMLINELINMYFHYVSPFFPFIHKYTFYTRIAEQPPLLVNAMCAFAARFSTNPKLESGSPATAGDLFYLKARDMVDQAIDNPSVSSVCALLLLTSYAAEGGRESAAYMYSGMAIRMAQELRLNIEPELDPLNHSEPVTMSWLERETRRRVWWGCVITDRYTGVSSDRNMIIDEKDCKVYLPSGDAEWAGPANQLTVVGPRTEDPFQLAIMTSSSTFTPGMQLQSTLAYYAVLIKIFGKIVERNAELRVAHRSKQTSSPISESDYQLSVLDASLREWFAALPDWMRELGNEFVPELESRNPPPWSVVYLHMLYYTCVILLHRPKMLEALRQSSSGANALFQNPAFLVCVSSANSIASIASKMAIINPHYIFMTSFVSFSIFQSGLVHLLCLQLGSQGILTPSQAQATFVAQAPRNVTLHLEALKSISKFYFLPNKGYLIYKNLLDTCNASLTSLPRTISAAGITASDRSPTPAGSDQHGSDSFGTPGATPSPGANFGSLDGTSASMSTPSQYGEISPSGGFQAFHQPLSRALSQPTTQQQPQSFISTNHFSAGINAALLTQIQQQSGSNFTTGFGPPPATSSRSADTTAQYHEDFTYLVGPSGSNNNGGAGQFSSWESLMGAGGSAMGSSDSLNPDNSDLAMETQAGRKNSLQGEYAGGAGQQQQQQQSNNAFSIHPSFLARPPDQN